MKTHTRCHQTIQRLNVCLACAIFLLAAANASRAGTALKLYYGGITGNAVSDLTSNPAFPNSPGLTEVLTAGLQEYVNFDEIFGAWTRGFIEAPQTGQYTFWIASDDDGEFWLSTSHDPAGKVKIAENIGFVGQNNYTAKASQKSALISLVRGQKYYFEMLHKEGGGGDHCSVAWTLPDGSFVAPISANHLWPFPVNVSDPAYPPVTVQPAILTDYLGIPVVTLPATITVEEGDPVAMAVTIEASQPAYVQWSSNNIPISNARLASFQIPAAGLAQNGDVYSVTITNSLGSATASTTITVTQDTTPPTLVDALNLGNPGGIVAVIFSEAVDPVTGTNAANYTLNNGAAVTSARFGSRPDTVLLRASGLVAGTTYTLTVNNVSDLAATPNIIAAGSTLAVEQALHTWLRLDENSGTDASDSSGNNRHGVLTNGAAPGHVGQVLRAVNFDSVNDHVRLPAGYDDFSTGMTVSLWANPAAIGNWARFIDLGNAPASDNILFARNGTSDALTFEVYVGGASGGQVTAGAAIVLNQWQHFVATLEPSGSTILYRNGIPVVTNNTGIPNLVTRTNNFLGRSNWGGDAYYGGKMDDVRIYHRVLSAAAIQALAAGAGADDVDPVSPAVTAAATVPITALHSAPPGVFTVTRTGSTASPLTVAFSLGGTATNGVNYTNLSTSLIIPAGASSALVYVQPIDFSFPDVQRTVVLTVAPAAAYNVGSPDSVTVTIANNNVAPAPLLATAGNAIGAISVNTVEVWFAAPVSEPSATTFANYSFNPPLTVTNATLGNRSLRVVLGISGPVPVNTVLTVANVQDTGGNSISNQLSVRPLLTNPVNLVASVYHSPDNNRPACFALATNGVTSDPSGGDGFDTWNSDRPDFAGLIYSTSLELLAVKVDLGRQFGDGGSWGTPPKLYRLKNPADTDTGGPEEQTNHWELVAAPIISGSLFDSAGDANPSPNTPIVFDLSGLPPAQRSAYGWAVGGVPGDAGNTFISISELSGYGVQGTTQAVQLVTTPANFTVPAGQRAKLKVWTTLPGISYQWQKNGGDVGETKSYYGVPPVSPADDNAIFTAVLSDASGIVASPAATLDVSPRATPAVVRAATFDPNNSVSAGVTNPVIYVWFDESVEPGSAQNMGNYILNDPGLSLVSAVPDAQGFRVILTYSGALTTNNLILTVASVQDLSGNVMTSQAVPALGLTAPASRVVANQYQQGRAAALTRSTDGQIINDPAVTTWTTFGGSPAATDFVGVGYAEPQVFSAVVMDLGWQFGDGGDWSEQPRVFIQKTAADTNQSPPENDANNWIEVPAILMSGNIFDGQLAVAGGTTPLPNGTIAFDLSPLPLAQRTGYGWAIGGVRGNAIPGQARFVTVAELRGFGLPASIPKGPVFTAPAISGANLIISGAGGTTNGAYRVLTSTNVGLAISNWTYVATNVFDANGNFSFTNALDKTVPHRFYLLQLP